MSQDSSHTLHAQVGLFMYPSPPHSPEVESR